MNKMHIITSLSALLALAGAGAQPARFCASNSPAPPVVLVTNTTASGAVMLRAQWGIEITSLRLSAHGRMVDFRYRVINPAKAAMLAKRETKPQLIDQASGAILLVPNTPKLGPLRQSATQLMQGKIYFALFANTRGIVKSGSQVTVAIGSFRAENLTVQ